MPDYTTLDYLPDLTPSQMASAIRLTMSPSSANTVGWDVGTSYGTTRDYAILYDVFSFTAQKGATIDIGSSSYFDPFLIRLYDVYGNVVAVNQEDSTYGTDFLTGFVAPYGGTYYVDAGWNQGSYYKACAIVVNEDLDTAYRAVAGTSSPDTLMTSDYNEGIAGGAGVDTVVYPFGKSTYTITHAGNTYFIADNRPGGSVDSLTDVERIKFADVTVAIDINDHGGQAYRVYQAAFNRTPDAGGLGFWIAAMDNGASLRSVAQGFVDSAEFHQVYGSNPTNFDLVNKFYQNVLHRAPDPSGLNYWVGVLESGADVRAGVLANISESAENQAGLVGVIGNGFTFTPYQV